ncbi:AAA family ATPase [Leptospira meyeri]|uniref:AAA family ATPase n=1 Tax=Leptospira meyeri TaxID=29508 RepID=UPI000C2A6458|nr:AAA family ATPase [Leptospira meyeri]PJZ79872.1 hypothetical protein CH359_15170 [Leptospira meyeri]PJZ96168.1 hypothetical protein CH358_14740 [Leptospira meyeri]
MNRIKKIEVKNFRAYRTEKAIETDADIILITGKNGSGKTSLLQAITLALNGFDSNFFGSLDLINRFSDEDTIRIQLSGLDIENTLGSKTKINWKSYSSPFKFQNANLNAAIRRVATAYFQDKAGELANGEFLSYLTGATNQGIEIINWLKSKTNEWRRLSESADLTSQDWNQKRIIIFQSIAMYQREFFPLIESYHSVQELNPFVKNGELRKDWQNTVVRFSNSLGGSDGDYGVSLIESIQTVLKNKLQQLEEKWKSEADQSSKTIQTKNKLLAELSKISEETISFDSENHHTIVEKLKLIEQTIDKVKKEIEDINSTEPKDGSLELLLESLVDNFEPSWREIVRLESFRNPVPEPIRKLLETIKTFDLDSIQALYEDWINSLSVKKNQKNIELSEMIKERDKLQCLNSISILLEEMPEFQELKNKKNISKDEVLGRLTGNQDSQEEERKHRSIRAGISNLLEELRNLIQVEIDFAKEQEELLKLDSLQQAKKFASEWADVLNKESLANGELSKIMKELDLFEINNSIKTILSLFHLPKEFIEDLNLEQKGTGTKAFLNPNLGKVDFENLSTGQKTIFALAWTIVLNQSLISKIGHKVMLFDDITTSLDLNQIIPACVLFRKLAYSNDPNTRRQLFITSHHEDLTNKLIDNLIPPDGFSMKIMELQDFRIEEGPIFDTWNVSPGKSVTRVDSRI